ncbi:MAG TPA: tripartite tricarboxylate transporter substrate binding protein [Burkholderiales bacterium]|nr:tripartite tricarboxylate transporter substrate binding protein [Burkholderiales bacterium]
MRPAALLAALILSGAPGGYLWSADYPARPLRMIVGFPPGGGADIMARLISEQLGERLGVQVVVDNRPGAGSSTAAGLAAKAAPDGYTLLFSTTSFTINPNLYQHVPYDPIRDFAPVSQVASSPFVLVVQQSMPVNSIGDLIALAKAKPGTLNYSSGGNGSTGHLAGELFNSMAGVHIQHVPYKGLAAALTDLLGGRVDITLSSLPSCINYIKSNRLKALAITTIRRMPLVREIPTMAEAGLAGYDVDQWYGVLGPAGMPDSAVQAVYGTLAKFLGHPDTALSERFATLGATPVATPPAEFTRFLRSNLALWQKAVKLSGAKVD